MTKLPPFKFLQYIHSCAHGFSLSDPHLYDLDTRGYVREGGFINNNNQVTPLGRHVLKKYETLRPTFKRLALDLLEELEKPSKQRAPIPMCGYALGYAREQGWVEETLDGYIRCTDLGKTFVQVLEEGDMI